MRITSVVMYSGETELASFALGLGETPDRYLIKAMSGLDADNLIPRFYAQGLSTGVGLFDFGLPPREMVFRIGLSPNHILDETFSELRDTLYRAISADRTGVVRIQFNSGSSVVSQIFGSIIKFEASLFTRSPEAQLTIRCANPFFRGLNPLIWETPDLDTSNPIVVADSLSTAPHGFVMSIEFNAPEDDIVIQGTASDPEWIFKVVPTDGFEDEDVLVFSSESSNRYAYILRGEATIPVVDGITLDSVWPVIFPGVNNFYLSEMGSVSDFTITTYPAYWGV